MKLRVALSWGSGHVPSSELAGLALLHSTGPVAIHGDGGVTPLALADGRLAFLLGVPVGYRGVNGLLQPLATLNTLSEFLSGRSIEACQESLEGRFVLAIVGPGDTLAICADQFGQHEVFYQRGPETLVFSSELALLPRTPGADGFDQVALAHALVVYGYRPPKRHTLYLDVRRLGVREVFRAEAGQQEFSVRPFEPVATRRYGQRQLEEYADLLIDAVRIRGSQHGNVVSLSSGWDSTAILACLVHVFGAGKVRGVIGRMKYASRSGVINKFEVDRAQAIAAYYGVPLEIADYDYTEQGPDWIERIRPLLQSHMIGGINGVSRSIWAARAAESTRPGEAGFSGEISDGAHNLGFAQFATILDHPVHAFREYSDKMASYLFGPTFLGRLYDGTFGGDSIYSLLRGRAKSALFDEPITGDRTGATLQLLSSFFLRSHRLPMMSLRNSKMLVPGGLESYAGEMERDYLRPAAAAADQTTLYAWYLHLYNSFHWQSSSVAAFSVVLDEHNITPQLPFWDSRLQEFLSAMPEDWGRGLDLNTTKYPLKWTLRNRVDYPFHLQSGPHSYLYDVDPSFNHGAEILYGSAFTPYFRESLRTHPYRAILSSEMFDLDYLERIVTDYISGREASGGEVSDLFSLISLSVIGWYEG